MWALIFSYFVVPRQYQHRVLFWGIFGALLLRLVFIFAGVALINRFDWILYVFGAFLVFTGIRLVFKQEEVHPEHNPVLRFVRRVVPSTHGVRRPEAVHPHGDAPASCWPRRCSRCWCSSRPPT